jgi:hypothetical protein
MESWTRRKLISLAQICSQPLLPYRYTVLFCSVLINRDDALQTRTNEVTDALRRTTQTMQTELERSVLSVQMLGKFSVFPPLLRFGEIVI